MTFLAKGAFGLRCAAVSRSVPLVTKQTNLESIILKSKPTLDVVKKILSPVSYGTQIPTSSVYSVRTGVNVSVQARYAHTDVTKVPSFDSYRLDSTKNPNAKKSDDADVTHRTFQYTLMFGTSVIAAVGAKHTVTSFLDVIGPSGRSLAEAVLEINLSNIPEGKNAVFKWRSKPLFVRRRSAAEVDKERAFNHAQLRDPERDEDRVKKAEWLVCLGICTHLGCVPISGLGDYGGYYCPCHGSHYDASGRIRRGPAPRNLEVPEYRFLDDTTIVVG